MGMMNSGLSYWQAETEGIDLLALTIGDLLDQRAEENPALLPVCRELSSDGQWQGAEVCVARAGHQSAESGGSGEDQNSITRRREGTGSRDGLSSSYRGRLV
jgi:hypothetical protein